MTTPTVYARVSPELKEAVDGFAEQKGMSLASAVTDLLQRGLEAAYSEEAIRSLELRTQQLQGELSKVGQAASVVDERMRQVLGTCQCGKPLNGHDFLVAGKCPECSRGVTGLLVGQANESAGSVDRNELAPFLAGIGVAAALIALTYAATQQ